MTPRRSRTQRRPTTGVPLRAGLALAAALLAVGGSAVAGAPQARADDPVTLSRQGQITDRVTR
ncbi:hypothetical protein [Streptomyces sp. NPDC005244]|uniref:hypothetical protein n=1 Tax=Streptomyces sp. NPDC005244 TaxID=3364708 RepID=UPI0036A3AC45